MSAGPTHGDGEDEPEASLSKDEMTDLLADRHRRSLLEYLAAEADPTVALDDAAAYVTAQAAAETDSQPHEDDVKASLHHRHIPRLAESGLVDFDEHNETIRYHENERLEAFHERLQDYDPE